MLSALRLSVVVFVVAACAPAVKASPQPVDDVALPDFGLVDVNPASATSGQTVGPRDFRGKVSGWYFTHST